MEGDRLKLVLVSKINLDGQNRAWGLSTSSINSKSWKSDFQHSIFTFNTLLTSSRQILKETKQEELWALEVNFIFWLVHLCAFVPISWKWGQKSANGLWKFKS